MIVRLIQLSENIFVVEYANAALNGNFNIRRSGAMTLPERPTGIIGHYKIIIKLLSMKYELKGAESLD